VPEDVGGIRPAAKAAKLKLKGPKKVFLIDGDDRVGALSARLQPNSAPPR